jgi:hypothetical protein
MAVRPMDATEYILRSAAWKHCEAAITRMRQTDDDTEAVLGDLVQKLTTIRQELADDRRAKAFQGKLARA